MLLYYEDENVKISYKVKGFGYPLILLHGWQMHKETFDSLARDLSADFKVYQIDLPGFGLSVASEALSVEAYADVIHGFISKYETLHPIILGHSFGGRIAICYACKYPIKKLILVGVPGIRKPLNWYRRIKQFIHKKIRIVKGSSDYEKANELLKKTLVLAVNYDLSEKLLSINCPTLLIWGKNDKEVKLKIACEMEKRISGSELVVIPKCGHFPYLERYRYFLIVLRYFLLKDNLCLD